MYGMTSESCEKWKLMVLFLSSTWSSMHASQVSWSSAIWMKFLSLSLSLSLSIYLFIYLSFSFSPHPLHIASNQGPQYLIYESLEETQWRFYSTTLFSTVVDPVAMTAWVQGHVPRMLTVHGVLLPGSSVWEEWVWIGILALSCSEKSNSQLLLIQSTTNVKGSLNSRDNNSSNDTRRCIDRW